MLVDIVEAGPNTWTVSLNGGQDDVDLGKLVESKASVSRMGSVTEIETLQWWPPGAAKPFATFEDQEDAVQSIEEWVLQRVREAL